MQELERTGHLLAAQVALAERDVVEESDLAFVDEQAQFSGFREVGLRGQQGERLERRKSGIAHDTVPAGLREGCCRDGKQCAAQAIAHGMHRCGLVLQVTDGLQHIEHAELQVVVHGQVVVGCIRIAPGQHVDGVPLAHEVAHHRVFRRQVQDVELHDPRRNNEDRLGMHVGRLGVVADQFDQAVAVHDLARRHRHIAPDLEAVLLRQVIRCGHAADVGHPVVQALEQVSAIGLGHVLQHHGVRGQPVGGSHHAQPLPGKETGEVGMMRGHSGNPGGFAPERLRVAEAGAHLAEGPMAPGLVAKTRIIISGCVGIVTGLGVQRVAGQLSGERGQFHLPSGRYAEMPGPIGHRQSQRNRRK